MKRKLRKTGGFTLVEMLIVVAIIAILIAVSIPLVSTALEQARDRTDMANERAAKAEAAMAFMGISKIYKNESDTEGTDFKDGAFTGKYYDATNGRLQNEFPKDKYGQCTNSTGSSCGTNSDAVFQGTGGTHQNAALKVTVDDNGGVTLEWATPS